MRFAQQALPSFAPHRALLVLREGERWPVSQTGERGQEGYEGPRLESLLDVLEDQKSELPPSLGLSVSSLSLSSSPFSDSSLLPLTLPLFFLLPLQSIPLFFTFHSSFTHSSSTD